MNRSTRPQLTLLASRPVRLFADRFISQARGLDVDAGPRRRRHLRVAGDVAHIVVMVMRGERDLQRVLPGVMREGRCRSERDAQGKRPEAEGGAIIHVYSSVNTARPRDNQYRGGQNRILKY